MKLFRLWLKLWATLNRYVHVHGVVIFMLVLMILTPRVYAQSFNVKTYIPKGAYTYKQVFIDAIKTTWPDSPMPAYIFSLAEHESCVSLTSARCLNPKSTLHTARELGVGFGQTTIAYRLRPGASNKDFAARMGVRFDALKENKGLDPRLMKEANWATFSSRPDLQAILMTAMIRQSYNRYVDVAKTPMDALRFADASYNAGAGMTRQRRLRCSFQDDCDPGVWFDNAENTCAASRKHIYGNRSACDINEHHVEDTTVTRLPKYVTFLAGEFSVAQPNGS